MITNFIFSPDPIFQIILRIYHPNSYYNLFVLLNYELQDIIDDKNNQFLPKQKKPKNHLFLDPIPKSVFKRQSHKP